MSETFRQENESNSKYTFFNVSMSIAVLCFYMVGLYIHTRKIRVCIKEKELTWKLDILNSFCILIHWSLSIFMRGITYMYTDLYSYTGKWLCYTYKAINMYGRAIITGHSAVICLLKYTIIVHYIKVRKIGQEKVKTIFFWINVLYPVYINAVFSIVRPEYFIIYDGVSAANKCLGLSDVISSQDPNMTAIKFHNVCEIPEPTYKYSFEYVIYLCRTSICWINVIVFYLNAWNIIECFIYFQTFRFMNR